MKISAKVHAKFPIWMSTIKERKWVSIQHLSKRGYILRWFKGRKEAWRKCITHLFLLLC